MTYLLDTNACISHLKHPGTSKVTQRMAAQPPGEVVLCSVVKAELLYGARASRDAVKNLAELQRFFGVLTSLPFDDAAAEKYGEIRATLSAAGTLIGPNDLMIGAITLANNLTLVTHNVSEFSRVPGLKLEDWEGGP